MPDKTSQESSIAAENRLDRLYAFIANEETRVCDDIEPEACRHVPGNFFLQLASLTLTKTGDALVNAKTVLAWLLGTLGAPVGFVALLVPIRESGSMLPQLFIAGPIRAFARRKWVWVAGSVLQALAILGMAGTALLLEEVAAGIALIGALTLFSLARGLSSIASKDVLGKTVPKRRRGRLNGLASTVAGLATITLGAVLLTRLDEETPSVFFVWILLAAALLWLLASSIYGAIREHPLKSESGGGTLTEAGRSLALLKTDAPLRRFVIARALLLCSALSAPYYVLLAQRTEGATPALLGGFILAGGLASSLSAAVWGWLADRSSRLVMAAGGFITAATGVTVFLVDRVTPETAAVAWFFAGAYFFLNIAHSGVRLGRKTFLVDLAGGDKRTRYVAVSNSAIGLILLVIGVTGAIIPSPSPAWNVLALSLAGLLGAVLSQRLPEVTAGNPHSSAK